MRPPPELTSIERCPECGWKLRLGAIMCSVPGGRVAEQHGWVCENKDHKRHIPFVPVVRAIEERDALIAWLKDALEENT